jgi:hypothetical protein
MTEMTEIHLPPRLPARLDETFCHKCQKRTHVHWKMNLDETSPYCFVCNTLSWEAMAQLNRHRHCYCQNHKD